VCAVTPRLEVLARSTAGTDPTVVCVVDVAVDDALDGAAITQSTVPTSTTPTVTTVRTCVARGRRTK